MIRGKLVEFRALKVTCVLVSLACPISSDVSFVNTDEMNRYFCNSFT